MLNINTVSLEEISLKPYVETTVENVFICPETQTVLFLGADSVMEVSMDSAASKFGKNDDKDNIEESDIERAIKNAVTMKNKPRKSRKISNSNEESDIDAAIKAATQEMKNKPRKSPKIPDPNKRPDIKAAIMAALKA